MIPTTASRPIHGAHDCAALGSIGSAVRMKPEVPSFSMIAASSTDPTVGASVWASGNQVWNGHIGTLIANPRNNPRNVRLWNDDDPHGPAARKAIMSNVWAPVLK